MMEVLLTTSFLEKNNVCFSVFSVCVCVCLVCVCLSVCVLGVCVCLVCVCVCVLSVCVCLVCVCVSMERWQRGANNQQTTEQVPQRKTNPT